MPWPCSVAWASAVAAGLSALLAVQTAAHPLAPTLLDVREGTDGRVEVEWKASLLRPAGVEVQPVLPEHCSALGSPAARADAESVVLRWTADCGEQGLIGQRLGFEGLAEAKIDGLVRVTLADGRLVRGVVRGAEPVLEVPAREQPLDVVRGYLVLGVEHILMGLDHLLFVTGLLLLARGTRELVKLITAFTVGHSVTLSLAVLGLVDLPSAPIELLIALSVLLLAVELARNETSRPTLIRRQPWLMALLFGLLHGLGFAGALTEAGLPQADIPLALLSFNAGIEIGQLLFVAGLLVAGAALHPLRSHLPAWTTRVPLYAMGSLAAMWCYERAAELF